ncbi:hypothetical protein JCM8202_001394 [Rhodotorula sphaerocarpa]
MSKESSPPRNHHRTSSPPNAAHLLPPPVPRRPTMLARPSQGYPFPVMQYGPPAPPAKKVTMAMPAPQHRRKIVRQDDGWDTPTSDRGSRSPDEEEVEAEAEKRPAGLQRGASSFSTSSDEATPSSSSCDTPDDDEVASTDNDEPRAELVEGPDGQGRRGNLAVKAATRRLKKQLQPSRPTTPVEIVHARTKHAGSTPGGPPPAPFYHPDYPHAPDSLLDQQDVRSRESQSPPQDTAEQANGARANPLSKRVSGMTLSSR